MNTRPDDWEQDEERALNGLEEQLAAIRLRHADSPSLGMLRAARADALPDALQAGVTKHLAESAWSRALVEGMENGGEPPALDRLTEERIWGRIRRAGGAPAARPGMAKWVWGSAAALAASVLLAVSISRSPAPTAAPEPGPQAAAPSPAATAPAAPAAAPTLLAFSKPDLKLTAAALTWRGAPAENPFLLNLKPAVDAYRDGDYVQADERFTALALQYPESVEVLFFQGVTRMLRDDFAGAVAPLTAAHRLGEPTFVNDAAWYLAVAEQRSGRAADARARLEELCAGTSAFKDRACAARQQLEEGSPRP